MRVTGLTVRVLTAALDHDGVWGSGGTELHMFSREGERQLNMVDENI